MPSDKQTMENGIFSHKGRMVTTKMNRTNDAKLDTTIAHILRANTAHSHLLIPANAHSRSLEYLRPHRGVDRFERLVGLNEVRAR